MGASNSLSSMVFFFIIIVIDITLERKTETKRQRERGKHDRNSSEDGMLDLPLE